jgi:hypothetical protein
MSCLGIFKESDGAWSMRRVLAFLFGVLGLGAGTAAVSFGAVWQVVAIAFGFPILACLILLFFTTWTDVIAIINAFRSKGI